MMLGFAQIKNLCLILDKLLDISFVFFIGIIFTEMDYMYH